MHKSKTILPVFGGALSLIVLLILVIPAIISKESAERFETILEEKYGVDFIYDGRETKDIDDFYVKSEFASTKQLVDGKNTSVYIYHTNSEPNTPVCFYYKEYYTYEVFPTKNEWYDDDYGSLNEQR